MDRGQCGGVAGCPYRKEQCDRRGQCGNEGCPAQCGSVRQSVPGTALCR